MAVLLLAEHDNASLNEATSKTLTAALRMDAEVTVLCAGSSCAEVATEAAGLSGVAGVLCAQDDAFGHGLAEPLAALIVSLADQYEHLVAPATASGKNVMARVAGLLDVMILSDITRVDGPDTFERPIYAGNAMQTVRSGEAKKVVTVRATAFDAAPPADAPAPLDSVAAVKGPWPTRYVGEESQSTERPELTSARVVISGGRGMAAGENFAMLESVADKLHAAVGASRAAVDAGYAPNDMQVGQTGKVVAPELYIAVGISGAIQHLAGMKDSKVIVAINKDSEAPIFQVADYGLVADLFDAVPQLDAALGALQD